MPVLVTFTDGSEKSYPSADDAAWNDRGVTVVRHRNDQANEELDILDGSTVKAVSVTDSIGIVIKVLEPYVSGR